MDVSEISVPRKASLDGCQQPKDVPGRGSLRALAKPIILPGSSRSIARLKQLGFDPMERLVIRHRELTEELEYQKKRRSGAIVELRQDGKPRAFVLESMLAIHDKLIAIEKELLRYNYGRVPETGAEDKPPKPSLTIELTKKGETYVINDDDFAPIRDPQGPQDDEAPWD